MVTAAALWLAAAFAGFVASSLWRRVRRGDYKEGKKVEDVVAAVLFTCATGMGVVLGFVVLF